MLIGIISDVHNNLRHLNEAIKFFNKKKIGLLIHGGDWGMPFTIRTFIPLQCPIKGVLGNGDPDIEKFLYQLQNVAALKNLDLQLSFRFLDFTVDKIRFGVFHGDDENLNNYLVESQKLDVLCLGHNHQPAIEQRGKTLVINPGSLVGYMYETGNQPVTVALYDTENKNAEIIDLKL